MRIEGVKIRVDDKVKTMVRDFINIGSPAKFNEVVFSWWLDRDDLSCVFELKKDVSNYHNQIITTLSNFSYELIKILKTDGQWRCEGVRLDAESIIESIISEFDAHSETMTQLSELVDFGADCFYIKDFEEWNRFVETYNKYIKHKDVAK